MCDAHIRFVADQYRSFAIRILNSFQNIGLCSESKSHLVENSDMGRQELSDLVTDVSCTRNILCRDNKWHMQPICHFDHPAHSLQKQIVLGFILFLYKRRLDING